MHAPLGSTCALPQPRLLSMMLATPCNPAAAGRLAAGVPAGRRIGHGSSVSAAPWRRLQPRSAMQAPAAPLQHWTATLHCEHASARPAWSGPQPGPLPSTGHTCMVQRRSASKRGKGCKRHGTSCACMRLSLPAMPTAARACLEQIDGCVDGWARAGVDRARLSVHAGDALQDLLHLQRLPREAGGSQMCARLRLPHEADHRQMLMEQLRRHALPRRRLKPCTQRLKPCTQLLAPHMRLITACIAPGPLPPAGAAT